jgi:hypothetical protein
LRRRRARSNGHAGRSPRRRRTRGLRTAGQDRRAPTRSRTGRPTLRCQTSSRRSSRPTRAAARRRLSIATLPLAFRMCRGASRWAPSRRGRGGRRGRRPFLRRWGSGRRRGRNGCGIADGCMPEPGGAAGRSSVSALVRRRLLERSQKPDAWFLTPRDVTPHRMAGVDVERAFEIEALNASNRLGSGPTAKARTPPEAEAPNVSLETTSPFITKPRRFPDFPLGSRQASRQANALPKEPSETEAQTQPALSRPASRRATFPAFSS